MSNKATGAPGKAPFRRLDFFRTFIATTGDTLENVAKIVGITKVQLGNWFRKDNARVDQLMKIVGHYGFVMDITMTTKDAPSQAAAPLRGKDFKMDGDKYSVSRLAFLAVGLREAGITQVELARRLGISHYSVAAWIKTDTVSYSRLFDVAAVTGLNIFVHIHPADEGGPQEKDLPVVDTQITLRKRNAIPMEGKTATGNH